MVSVANALALWTTVFEPSGDDLADRALRDTVACAIAARDEPINSVTVSVTEAGRRAVAAHVLDYDDLHVPSTTHISTVCVPVALALGGGPVDNLAGAGVMARLGWLLGWEHYAAGWHATATTGVIGAASVAASRFGLSDQQREIAIALAVSSSSGVQRAFGSDAKSLQVGLAALAGVQAALLAADGAVANSAAVEQWLELVGGADPERAAAEPATHRGRPRTPGPGRPADHPADHRDHAGGRRRTTQPAQSEHGGWRASSASSTPWPRRCSTTIRGSPASPTRGYAARWPPPCGARCASNPRRTRERTCSRAPATSRSRTRTVPSPRP